MQLKIPIISGMLLISDNFRNWCPSWQIVAKIFSILAFTHDVNLALEQLQMKAGPLGLKFERQQRL